MNYRIEANVLGLPFAIGDVASEAELAEYGTEQLAQRGLIVPIFEAEAAPEAEAKPKRGK